MLCIFAGIGRESCWDEPQGFDHFPALGPPEPGTPGNQRVWNGQPLRRETALGPKLLESGASLRRERTGDVWAVISLHSSSAPHSAGYSTIRSRRKETPDSGGPVPNFA